MKYLLVGLGLLFGRAAFGQQQPVGVEVPAPFKGANTILIHTPDSIDAALDKLARALIVSGIEPDKIDSHIGYLTTKPKPVGQLTPAAFQYRAIASREPGGTLLAITGAYTVQMSLARSMTQPMYWVKGNMLQAKLCFVTIQPAAEAYPGGRVAYLQNAKP